MSRRASLLRTATELALPILGALGLVMLLPGVTTATAAPTMATSALANQKQGQVGLSTLAPQAIENPGFPDAYYYKPRSGRSMKPVIVYLHGRGGNPAEGCRDWAKVGTEFGWVLCPSGQEDRGGGSKGWGNDPINSQKNVEGALLALRKKFGRRVQLYGNVLIGFSEGAFIAQNIGEHDPKTFNRWLIIASCDRYFGYDKTILETAKKKIKRVYLWTGEMDMVVNESNATFEHLKALKVPVKLNVPKGYWHAIPSDTMSQNFRKALKWLVTAK
jgi:predicted esterase